jgi:hypothetical protein
MNTLGSQNVAVGSEANVSLNNLINANAFGQQAVANASTKVVIGSNWLGIVIGGYAGWSNLSDGRFKNDVNENVPGLSFITKLRPVTYTIDIDKLQHHITAAMPDSIARRYLPGKEEIEKSKQTFQTGFIAQEVEATAKQLNYAFDGVNAPKNSTDNYSIVYSQFVPSLVKAVQEQQQIILTQNAAITQLQQKTDKLEAELQQIRALLSGTKN